MKMNKTITAICLGLILSGASVSTLNASVNSSIEVGFSPDGSGEALVLRSINSARQSIRLAAYSFTAAPVALALVNAKKPELCSNRTMTI